jgi:hypothetical protein
MKKRSERRRRQEERAQQRTIDQIYQRITQEQKLRKKPVSLAVGLALRGRP